MTAAWSGELLAYRTGFVHGVLIATFVAVLVGLAVWRVRKWIAEDAVEVPYPRRRLFDVRHANDFEAWEDELK